VTNLLIARQVPDRLKEPAINALYGVVDEISHLISEVSGIATGPRCWLGNRLALWQRSSVQGFGWHRLLTSVLQSYIISQTKFSLTGAAGLLYTYNL